MSTAIQKVQPIQEGLTQEQVELITRTVARGATPDELALFLYQCKRTGLDPLLKQIHAVKRWDSQAGRETMTIQTGIDGYRLVATRTNKLAGIDDAVFDKEDAPNPGKASVTVYKLDETGQARPYTASARWSEYVQTKKDGSVTSFWKRMPYGQLGKCAEALALRKAFPNDLSGVYTHEEMAQGDTEENGAAPFRLEQTAAPDGGPAVKCEDCKRAVIGYTGADGPITMGQAIAQSKDRFEGKIFCGGCQIKHGREQKETPKPEVKASKQTSFKPEEFPNDPEIVQAENGLWWAQGTVTQVFHGGKAFSFKMGTTMFTCWHKSLVPHFVSALKKKVEFAFKFSSDEKFRNVERLTVVDGKQLDESALDSTYISDQDTVTA